MANTFKRLLFDEDQCTCGDKKGDHKLCLKYIRFHVLAIKYDDTYVIHPCEHDRVIAFIEGKPPTAKESRTKKHKVSK